RRCSQKLEEGEALLHVTPLQPFEVKLDIRPHLVGGRELGLIEGLLQRLLKFLPLHISCNTMIPLTTSTATGTLPWHTVISKYPLKSQVIPLSLYGCNLQ